MTKKRSRRRIIVMGAAGRDFHNFNQVYRQNPEVEVIAFTAAQISGIANRSYPPILAGSLYPEGIPIVDETQLETLCQQENIDQVIFAYSDVTHSQVMHIASRVLVAGADFLLLGPEHTMLTAKVPVIAVSAVRTGCGKSQTTRWLSKLLRQKGLKVAIIRHPMPYGDLEKQRVQRFTTLEDLTQANCTIEEREEYEPHLVVGNIVYAGVDYELIVKQAQEEADIIVWDGGNNDFPFIRPDLHIVLVDPLRPGNETTHHPGEVVLRMADVVIIAKVDAAADADIQQVRETVQQVNPKALIIRGKSPITLENPELVRDRRVLVVEDGPTTTHGGMAYGAGYIAATRAHAAAIVDPRPYAVAEIAKIYEKYPHIGPVLPAMGYFPAQLKALEDTINHAEVDVVIAATPSNLGALIQVNKPIIRARYEFAEAQTPGLGDRIEQFLTTIL
ncbi:cyclic 2,3-diphosphoglycerate synthase [Crocosphaera sp. UHCC 0190]|uniref:cyclic 2,3-diphosphoglycerate synthase n=1 Tax=Crocosphaera sp. UHCC 0190 TaxID=3110246 RepID=UPI002B220B83|nr:cyclic 2,3-diphosphoglycerate synthase [Crocosphaera sp. UHCC 0190]MEA5509719.1 cyclic 2,3-diphosphoglycerate synthase [Crocosphaera sp. UHCC 0190]